MQEAKAATKKREETETTAAIAAYRAEQERKERELRRTQAAMRAQLAGQVQAAHSVRDAAAAQARCRSVQLVRIKCQTRYLGHCALHMHALLLFNHLHVVVRVLPQSALCHFSDVCSADEA